ncbi:hypothetical protein ACH5RR_020070 [Cinchona calisaya]|uniref:Ubiquitin-like domain-containing protein n=1 Tax=Cinchona calisaya TaxID=153742 RepID=A0ABD2ZF64_9GENT
MRRVGMFDGEEQVELKFRIFDGTDIGHGNYTSSTAIATLKQKLLDEWPQDKSVAPKSVDDIKLIHAGRVLDDEATLAESRIPIGDVSGVVTMHVVVQPGNNRKNTDKNLRESQTCFCAIL